MFVYSQEIDTINLCHKVITVIRKAFISLPEYLSVGIEMEDPPKALCTNISLYEHYYWLEHIVVGRCRLFRRSQRLSITFQTDMWDVAMVVVVEPFIG